MDFFKTRNNFIFSRLRISAIIFIAAFFIGAVFLKSNIQPVFAVDPPPTSSFAIDFSSIDYGNVKLNTYKIISGDLNFSLMDREAIIRNTGTTDLTLYITQDDMGLGSTSGLWNVKYDARIGNLSTDWTNYSPNQIIPLSRVLHPGETDKLDFSITVSKFSPNHSDIYTGVMTLSDPISGQTENIAVGLFRDTSGSAKPIIRTKWEMNNTKDINGGYLGTDDDIAVGAQFIPSGQYQANKAIAACAVATDPDGLADINSVYVDTFYPEEINLGPNYAPLPDQSGLGCGQLMQEDSMSKLNKTDGYNLFCNRVKNFNNNLPVFDIGYSYNEICGVDGELMNETAAVYCREQLLSYNDPSGEYEVQITVQDKAGLQGVFNNKFTYLPIVAFEVDFSSINYGNNIYLNTQKIVSGDLLWNSPILNKPTIRNVGNTRLDISLTQDDMGLGKTGDLWNVKYASKIGNSAIDWLNYNPFQTQILKKSLNLSETNQVDFAVNVFKLPPAYDGSYYNGTVFFEAVSIPHFGCETQPQNQPPTLSYSQDTGYIDDGINPNSGSVETDFKFKVLYKDIDNDIPITFNLFVSKEGETEIQEIDMLSLGSVQGSSYSDGVNVVLEKKFSEGIYQYYFEATDFGHSDVPVRLPESGLLGFEVKTGETIPEAPFYAEVQNTSVGAWRIRNVVNFTSASILKEVPNGWVIKVKNLHQNQIKDTDNKYIWWEVEDVTDGISGWMAYKEINANTEYLKYDIDNQIKLSEKVKIINDVITRKNIVVNTIVNRNELFDFSDVSISSEIFLAITAAEMNQSADNEFVSFDGGRGIGQITTNELVGQYSGAHCYCGTNKAYMPYEHISSQSINEDYWKNRECVSGLYDNQLTYRNCQRKDNETEWWYGGSQSENVGECKAYYFEGCKCKTYTNTEQGIVANLKDKFGKLKISFNDSKKANENTEKDFSFRSDLSEGSKKTKEIMYLQYILREEGFTYLNEGIEEAFPITGLYKAGTAKAVKEFQDKYLIFGETGVGIKTRHKLNELMTDKYIALPKLFEKLKIWAGTAWRYNGKKGLTTNYLNLVANRLDLLDSYFTNYKDKITDILNDSEKELLLAILKDYISAEVKSPVELRVYDLDNNLTGLINGQVFENISDSQYDFEKEAVLILFSSDDYRYEVVGNADDKYGLVLSSFSKDITFSAENISTTPNQIHQYSIDWQALSRGENGVTLQIDKEGDGTFEQTVNVGATLNDEISPTSEISILGTQGNNGWHTSDVQIELFSEDNEGGVGVEKIEYSLDGGRIWNKYGEPFGIMEEGIYTVLYRSQDIFGNIEEAKTAEIKIDKTKPVLDSSRAPEPNSNGWNNTDVTAHFDCADSLSGVESVTEDKIIATEGLDQSIIGICVDMAGNSVDAIISGINIDKTPPLITNNIPIDGAEYLLNQNIAADWQIYDALSGIGLSTGTVDSGQTIDTSSVGAKTFNIASSDKAGNQTARLLNYYVHYDYSGVLSPIKSDGSKFFKFGSTVPIKFQLKDSNGNFISTSNAYIYVNKVSDSVSGLEEVVSAGEANVGNLFRYDATDNQYIFNLSTKLLSIGTWQLSIKLDDETINKVNLSLKQ